MANVGYVRIGGTTYINANNEESRDHLIQILGDMGLDVNYEREDYYYDFVEDEMKYSWAFTIECTMEQTTEIVSRLETDSADDEDDAEE